MGRVMSMKAAPSEEFMGHSAGDLDVITVTPVCDTSIFASADLIADPVEIVGFFRVPGGRAFIDSIVILDEDDQGAAITLVFTQVSTSFGTLNSAPNITDANARSMVGHVTFATTDFFDVGGAKLGTRSNLGLMVEGASGATSLFVGVINGAGTPTYTASGLKLKIGVRRS